MKRKIIPAVLPVLLLCLLIATVIILLFSKSRLETLYYFFPAVFSNRLYLGEMLNQMVLLSLAGLGILLAFRAGAFNLGGEGQIYMGVLFGVLCSEKVIHLPGPVAIIIILLCGTLAGAFMAFLSGVMKAFWNVDELISSFLLSAGCIKVIDYLLGGPLSDPESYLLTSKALPAHLRISSLLPPSSFNISFLILLILLPLFYYYLNHTRQGYEWQLTGSSSHFARYGGLNTKLYETLPISISGALHGLAGTLALTGTYFAGIQGMTFGLGWNGLAVALIAGRKIPGLLPAAFFFAWLNQGSRLAQLQSDLSLELGAVIQGLLFLLISSSVLRYKYKKNRRGDKV